MQHVCGIGLRWHTHVVTPVRFSDHCQAEAGSRTPRSLIRSLLLSEPRRPLVATLRGATPPPTAAPAAAHAHAQGREAAAAAALLLPGAPSPLDRIVRMRERIAALHGPGLPFISYQDYHMLCLSS